jgi:hypothetical protein
MNSIKDDFSLLNRHQQLQHTRGNITPEQLAATLDPLNLQHAPTCQLLHL